jgi:hypothetical protein
MSSWSLIPAYSGFRYDGAAARITMLPRATPGDLVSFWSNAKAWGSFTVSARNRQFMLKLIDGETRCGELSLPRAIARTNVKLNGTKVPSSVTDAQLIKLSSPVVLKAGDQLEVGPTA